MAESQRVKEIMPGCKIAKTSSGDLMFGCPSEAIKVLAKLGIDTPSTIFLPTEFFKFGVVQAALEFLLYQFLFFQQKFFKGEKFRVIGTANQIKRIRLLFQITLNGPTDEMAASWGISLKERFFFKNLRKVFGLKKSDGQIADLDDMIQFIKFQDNHVQLGQVKIALIDDNVFQINDQGEVSFVDINIVEAQQPPLPIHPPAFLSGRPVFGATALSKCTTGFDPSGYTSSLVIWINGLGVLVDGVSWMKEHLRIHGINSREIRAYLLTHVHDDHSGILDMIIAGEKITLITTKVIYLSFLEKAACLLNWPVDEVQKMVNFFRVIPGKEFKWYGASFDFWYTAHSIPTIGFRVTVNGKSIVYSGDTLWGDNLSKAYKAGAIDERSYQIINNIPYLHSEIIFFDSGGGAIHPAIEDLATLPEQIRRRLVLTHRSSLPVEFSDRLRLVEAAQNWEIIPQKKWDAGDLMVVMNSPIFHGLTQEWINVLISQANINQYATGQTILSEGGPGKNFYLILGGTAGVLYGDEVVTRLSTGDFFGEISIMNGRACTATIKTISSLKTMELSAEIFLQIANSTKLAGKLGQIHQIRPILIKFGFIGNLDPSVVNRLVTSARVKKYKSGETIIRQGDEGDNFYGIIDGRVKVVAKSGGQIVQVATLYRGQCFGEIALLKGGVRTADVIAETDVEVFAISKANFQRIVGQTPELFYQLGLLADQRKKDLLAKIQA